GLSQLSITLYAHCELTKRQTPSRTLQLAIASTIELSARHKNGAVRGARPLRHATTQTASRYAPRMGLSELPAASRSPMALEQFRELAGEEGKAVLHHHAHLLCQCRYVAQSRNQRWTQLTL